MTPLCTFSVLSNSQIPNFSVIVRVVERLDSGILLPTNATALDLSLVITRNIHQRNASVIYAPDYTDPGTLDC